MKHNKLIAFLACNLAIVVLEIIGLGIAIKSLGWNSFVYYTQLSNILLLIAATINVFCSICALCQKKSKLPNCIWSIFHAAVSTTTVTFLVVVFVLSWMYGSLLLVLTQGSMLYTHTLCPILGIITHLIFAPRVFTKRAALRATGLTLLYAVVSITMNIARIWVGPYPFLMVYNQPVWESIAWVLGMLGGAWGISRLLLIGKIAKQKRRDKTV